VGDGDLEEIETVKEKETEMVRETETETEVVRVTETYIGGEGDKGRQRYLKEVEDIREKLCPLYHWAMRIEYCEL
jgi:hypothetical protein